MKVAIVTKTDEKKLGKILLQNGFIINRKNPDFVLCYGGDGTILYAERVYPSIPKLLIKSTSICRKCDYTFQYLKSILPKIKSGNYEIRKETKLVGIHEKGKLIGLNEIQVHTKLPIRAIRFSVSTNGKEFANLIGDGVIVATPFGSTGYYYATGGKQFKKGIGVSFNNLHSGKIKSFVVPENSVIKIKMNRDTALLLADNNEKFIELKENDLVTIKKASEIAQIIQV